MISALSPTCYAYNLGKSVQLIPFVCTVSAGVLKLAEHDEARWLGRQELYSVEWALADLPIVQELDRFWNPIHQIILDNLANR